MSSLLVLCCSSEDKEENLGRKIDCSHALAPNPEFILNSCICYTKYLFKYYEPLIFFCESLVHVSTAHFNVRDHFLIDL